jgi:hypothetical protein
MRAEAEGLGYGRRREWIDELLEAIDAEGLMHPGCGSRHCVEQGGHCGGVLRRRECVKDGGWKRGQSGG